MEIKGFYNYSDRSVDAKHAIKAIYIAWKYRMQGFKVILKCNSKTLLKYMEYNVDSFMDSCVVDESIDFVDGTDLSEIADIVNDLDPQFMFDIIWVRCTPHEKELLSVYSLNEYHKGRTT